MLTEKAFQAQILVLELAVLLSKGCIVPELGLLLLVAIVPGENSGGGHGRLNVVHGAARKAGWCFSEPCVVVVYGERAAKKLAGETVW